MTIRRRRRTSVYAREAPPEQSYSVLGSVLADWKAESLNNLGAQLDCRGNAAKVLT